jgi:hypothetical protein
VGANRTDLSTGRDRIVQYIASKVGGWFALALLLSLIGLNIGCAGGSEGYPAETGDARRTAVSESHDGPGALLYLAGDGELTLVDVDAGRFRVLKIPQLSHGDPPYRIIRVDDKVVLYSGDAAYTVDLQAGSTPQKLTEAWFFIPSATSDRLWVALLDPESPDTVRALKAVREITVDGRVTVADVVPPGGRWPVAAVDGALVFEKAGGLEVWDSATRRVKRVLPGEAPGPGRGSRLPWCSRDYGRLHVSDLRTGEELDIAPPAGFVAFDCSSAAFSPDGSLLAVPIAVGDGYKAARALALVDLSRGLATAVPGSRVPPGYVFVAWSSNGESVFISGGQRFEPRALVEYELGAERAAALPIHVGDFYGWLRVDGAALYPACNGGMSELGIVAVGPLMGEPPDAAEDDPQLTSC